MIAELSAFEFEHVCFEPIRLTGVEGRQRTFHFLLRHLGDRMSLDAFERADGERAGYQFQIVDAIEADPLDVMSRLVKRIRRALAMCYLVDEEWGTFIKGMDVSGRIGCDFNTSPSLPTIVIDGRDISWHDFGRMVTSFEGWQFKLSFKDPSKE